MGKIKYKIKDSNELITFLKRFSIVDNSLLAEINGPCLVAKTHLPDKSLVKCSKVYLSKLFSMDEGVENTDHVMFGIFNVAKLIQAIKHFGDSPIIFTLQYEYEKTSDKNTGKCIILSNDSIQITYDCASIRLFQYIEDNKMDSIASIEDSKVDFVMTKEMRSKINSLSSLDNDHKFIKFEVDKGQLKAEGKSFNINLLNLEDISKGGSIETYKTQFSLLDDEDSKVYVTEDRLVVNSIETDTRCVIGRAQTQE